VLDNTLYVVASLQPVRHAPDQVTSSSSSAVRAVLRWQQQQGCHGGVGDSTMGDVGRVRERYCAWFVRAFGQVLQVVFLRACEHAMRSEIER
jgi:hypothetical protein